jgi:hypothetical protein
VKTPAKDKGEIVLPTNHLQFGASTISAIYKDRWEIELFFKTLKQNLKVKTFVGESESALLIQIWRGLIPQGTFSCPFSSERTIHLVSLLMIKWLHHLSKAGWSFANMATMLRLNLFTYRWINEPFETPLIVPDVEQLSLAFSKLDSRFNFEVRESRVPVFKSVRNSFVNLWKLRGLFRLLIYFGQQ